MENQPSVLVCEFSKPDVSVTWLKDGQPITVSENLTVACAGTLHTLSINSTTLDDEAEYTAKVGQLSTKAELLVDGERLHEVGALPTCWCSKCNRNMKIVSHCSAT